MGKVGRETMAHGRVGTMRCISTAKTKLHSCEHSQNNNCRKTQKLVITVPVVTDILKLPIFHTC